MSSLRKSSKISPSHQLPWKLLSCPPGISCPKSPSLFDLLSSLLQTHNINQGRSVQGSPVSSSWSVREKNQLTVTKLGSRPVHAGNYDYVLQPVPWIFQQPLYKILRQLKIMWKTKRLNVSCTDVSMFRSKLPMEKTVWSRECHWRWMITSSKPDKGWDVEQLSEEGVALAVLRPQP